MNLNRRGFLGLFGSAIVSPKSLQLPEGEEQKFYSPFSPWYLLTEDCYLPVEGAVKRKIKSWFNLSVGDCVIYGVGAEIRYWGVPNAAMEPLSWLARRRHAAWKEGLPPQGEDGIEFAKREIAGKLIYDHELKSRHLRIANSLNDHRCTWYDTVDS